MWVACSLEFLLLDRYTPLSSEFHILFFCCSMHTQINSCLTEICLKKQYSFYVKHTSIFYISLFSIKYCDPEHWFHELLSVTWQRLPLRNSCTCVQGDVCEIFSMFVIKWYIPNVLWEKCSMYSDNVILYDSSDENWSYVY